MGTTFKPGRIMTGLTEETKKLILGSGIGQTLKAMIGEGVSEEGLNSFITNEVEANLDSLPALTIKEVLLYRDFVQQAFAKWEKINTKQTESFPIPNPKRAGQERIAIGTSRR